MTDRIRAATASGTLLIGRELTWLLLLRAWRRKRTSGVAAWPWSVGSPASARAASRTSLTTGLAGAGIAGARGVAVGRAPGHPPTGPGCRSFAPILRTADRLDEPAATARGRGRRISPRCSRSSARRFPDALLRRQRSAESASARFQLFDSTTTFLRNAAAAHAAARHPRRPPCGRHAVESCCSASWRARWPTCRSLVVGTYRDVVVDPRSSAGRRRGRDRPASRSPGPCAVAGLQADAGARRLSAPRRRCAAYDHLVSAVWRETKRQPAVRRRSRPAAGSAEGRLNDVADLLVPEASPSRRASGTSSLGGLTTSSSETAGAMARSVPPWALSSAWRFCAVSRELESPGRTSSICLSRQSMPACFCRCRARTVRYRFSHDLVRETLYDELAPGRRVRLHRRIADVLEQLAG